MNIVRHLSRRAVPAALVLASVAVSLLLGEALARAVLNPGDFLTATLVDDPVLGHRIAPNAPGHDALGFRNAEVPGRARVVAIGDSQTYGVGAARGDSWPAQLGGLLGEPVYSMALGGYGPLEYFHLAGHEARKLAPEVLVVGFYFGNDLMDAYSAAYERPFWREWRAASAGDAAGADARPAAADGRRFGGLRDWLARHSVLYSLLRVTLLAPFALRAQDQSAAQASPESAMVWTDPAAPGVRTIFTPQLRLAAIDPSLPRVREGLRLAKRALLALRDEASAQGARLLVVLIPTKERAYCGYLKESGARLPGNFAALCDAEDRVRAELAGYLASERVRHVDATPALEQEVRRHAPVYPRDNDGHPRAPGYGAIARAAFEALRAAGPAR